MHVSRPESAADDRPLELVPSALAPWWRRILVALLIGAPALVLLVADLAGVVDPGREPGSLSGWTGAAMCAIWLTLLARAILPLARIAARLEAVAAALAWAMLVLGLQLPLPALVLAALAGAVVLALRRPVRRTVAPRDRVERDLDVAGAVAFSETSADPTRAVLIALGCVGFAAIGAFTAVTTGPMGWWYLLAAAVWFTGAVPWMLRVTLDRTGLAVRTLLLPGALVRVPLADIDDVEAGTVRPRKWGGTGCVVDGGVTSVLRAEGGAVLVTRRDGTQVVVNVDRPDEAVATFAALRASGVAS
ncbi:hypothetical protein [Agrococcus jejuensis]|uniref:hypothetical protein n=1 Tax=Agrococcus jejuensis TaxID=399736 RepID=UPI0012FCC0A2|nr:hypothetical protein [Agrococcus jejuensis]